MKHAVILCNGEFPRKEYPLYLLRSAEIIICCDSERNASRLQRLGLEPTLIVGDMDSTPASVKARFEGRIEQVPEQDDNDLAKAFALLRERYPDAAEIHILGAGGRNEAHTVGNLGWLMEWERRSLAEYGVGLAGRGVNVEMVSDWSTAFALSPSPGQAGAYAPRVPGADRIMEATEEPSDSLPESEPEPVELFVGEGRKVSFFATDGALRVESEGLEWPLDGVDLSRWWGATLNRATADTVRLRFSHAAPLLVILD